jgi:hypothetical protein
MSSDYRMIQHHAAVATHGLMSAVEYLRGLFLQHPEIVVAERNDILHAQNKLSELIAEMSQRKKPAA